MTIQLKQLSASVVFSAIASLAYGQSLPPIPMPDRHAVLPGSGPVQDISCDHTFKGLRPGESIYKSQPATHQEFISSGRDMIIANDCRAYLFHLDETGQLTKQSSTVNLEFMRRRGLLKPPAAASAPALPANASSTVPSNWYSQPNFLPAHTDPARLSATIINPPKAFWETLRTRCVFSNGLTTRLGDGLIIDTRSVYQVVLDKTNNCTLKHILSISPRDPSTAKELVAEIQRLVPPVATALRGINPFSPGEPYPVSGVPGAGIRLDESDAVSLSLTLSFAKLAPATPAERPLTGEWWNDPALLPQKLARPLSVTARSGANRCTLSNGATVPLNSILIPDTSHAYFLDRNCTLSPLITVPDSAASAAVASTGGRFPVPVRGGLPTTPASTGPTTPQQTATVATLLLGTGILLGPQLATAGGGTGLAATAALLNPVTLIGGVVIISGAIALHVWTNQQNSGISDTQLGSMATHRKASPEGQVSSPSGPGWEPPPKCPRPGQKPIIDTKIQRQMARRGWTEADIIETFNNPMKVARATNKATWAPATAYFIDANNYVVIDNISGVVLQLSHRNDPTWKPDETFENPREKPQSDCRKDSLLGGRIQITGTSVSPFENISTARFSSQRVLVALS